MHALILTLAALTATALQAGSFGSDCQEFGERSAGQPAAGVTRVVIIGRAGYLHVEGRAGATEIRAEGRACAAIEELLVGIRLKASRSGPQVTIEAFVPKQGESLFASAPRLDFTVTLPAGMDVDVADTSGDLTISNVGDTRVAVTGSKLAIHNITGNLSVRDPSGPIDIDGVRGDVHLPGKTSGPITIARAGGTVSINDHRAGSIEVRNAKQNVVVASDGYGAVTIADVGGDLTLGSKKGGTFDYQRVSGRVTVPRRYRR